MAMTTVDPQQLHTSAIVADTHNDLLMAVVARPPDHWARYFRARFMNSGRAAALMPSNPNPV